MVAECRNQLIPYSGAIWCFISSHAPPFKRRISVALHDPLRTSLKEDGILTQREFAPAFSIIAALQRAARHQGAPFATISSAEMDRGTSFAIELLIPPAEAPIVALSTSSAGVMEHARAGEYLHDVLQSAAQPVILVITGDGSHRHTTDTAAGFSPAAIATDTEISHAIAQRSIAALVRAATIGVNEQECIIQPLALGFGALKGLATTRSCATAYDVLDGVGLHAAHLYKI